MSEETVKTAQEAQMADELITEPNTDDTVELESAEVTGSSMGGHSPKADIDPERRLVRSFGKWAKGKQHICVRVLLKSHPELCASRPGGCNGLCAWMKDQFLGTTKWRTGNKKNLVKKAVEGYIDLGDDESFVLPYDLAIDAMAMEADIADGKRLLHTRPTWFGPEEEALLIDLLEKDTDDGESTEADISYDVVKDKLRELVNITTQGKNEYAEENISSNYTYIRDVFPGYVIYAKEYKTPEGIRECDLYKQRFTVASENVSLVGDPSKVVHTYVAAESDVDEPVSSPAEGWNGENVKNVPVNESEADLTETITKTEEVVDEKDSFVLISTESGILAVETDDSGKIVRGPNSLIGSIVPEVDDSRLPANEAFVSESGILKGAGITEVEVSEMVIQESEVTTSTDLKTPSNKVVDGIIRIIVPGPGNSKDRFYYSEEAIKNTLGVFDGKKMYKNHTTRKQDMDRDGQPRNVDDWVATVEETWIGNDGVGYGGINFVDDSFQAKAKKGKSHLGVSVRGRVKARPGKVGGTQYNVVEGFTYGGSVDFVTEAGAGGGFVSIAESEIMEGNMDPKEMTLDELMEANPAAFVQHAERVQAESKESITVEEPASAGETITLDAISSLMDTKLVEFGTQLKAEVKESLTTRDVQDNRMILDTKLKASGLPSATQKRLIRELHDVTFDGAEATESEPAKTPLEMFADHADKAIAEADQEIKEATSSVTTVDDGGSSELIVTESGRIAQHPAGVMDKINSRFGIKLGSSGKDVPVVESKVEETSTDEASAKTS